MLPRSLCTWSHPWLLENVGEHITLGVASYVIQCTLYVIQYTVNILKCIACSLQHSVNSVKCIADSLQYTVNSLKCRLKFKQNGVKCIAHSLQ